MEIVKKIALALIIIGAVNWGLVGIFSFNLVDFLFGNGSILTRIIYVIVAVAGILSLVPLFTDNERDLV